MVRCLKTHALACMLLLVSSFLFPLGVAARGNAVMGKVEFKGETKGAKTSGVWVDGQYVGYLHELRGSKSVLLLPGRHQITVREDGYKDFNQEVTVQPGETRVVYVSMRRARTLPFPSDPALLKIAVDPSRAAVFVDGEFVGHVGEFRGIGKGMLVTPGRHRIKIALPGYQTFETDIDPIANQKVEVKTSLIRTNAPLRAPLVKSEGSTNPPPQSADSMAVRGH